MKTGGVGVVALASMAFAFAGLAQTGGVKSGQAATPQSIIITEDRNGQTVDVPVGGDAAVTLVVAGGTGYGWTLDPPSSGVVVVGKQKSTALHPGLAGGPQQTVFHFQMKAPGSVTLHFSLQRPWEKSTPPAKTFAVTLRAR